MKDIILLIKLQKHFKKGDRFENLQRLEAVVTNSHIRDTFATNISGTTILEKVDFGPHGPEAQGGRRRLDVLALSTAVARGWICSTCGRPREALAYWRRALCAGAH
jgi:hypothetical protein